MIVFKLDVVNGVAVSLKGFWMVRQNDLATSQLPRLSFESKSKIGLRNQDDSRQQCLYLFMLCPTHLRGYLQSIHYISSVT